MRQSLLAVMLVLIIIITSGCVATEDKSATTTEDNVKITTIDKKTTMSPDSIYSNYRDSVVYLDMICNVTISYIGFDIEYDYDNYYYDDYLTLRLNPLENDEYATYETGAYGSGFIFNDKIVSNSHVVECDESFELSYLQDHLLYLNELAKSYYLNGSYINYLVNFDPTKEAEYIHNEISRINPGTQYTQLDIEDWIVNQIALHLYDTARIQKISKEDVTVFYTVSGNQYNESLAVIESGYFFPDKDYAILVDGDFESERIVMGDADNLSIGEEIYVIGYPDYAVLYPGEPLEPTITRGIVSSKKNSGMGIEYIQIDAATSGGSSGGPVFNKYGEVVGILTAGTGESFNFVLPSKYFIKSL